MTIGPEGTSSPCHRNSPGFRDAGSVPGGFGSFAPQKGTFAMAAVTTRDASTRQPHVALRVAANFGLREKTAILDDTGKWVNAGRWRTLRPRCLSSSPTARCETR